MRKVDFWPRRPFDPTHFLRGASLCALIIGLLFATGYSFRSVGEAAAVRAMDEVKKANSNVNPALSSGDKRASLEAEKLAWVAQQREIAKAPALARDAMRALSAFRAQGAQVERFMTRWGSTSVVHAEGVAESREAALEAARQLAGFGSVGRGGPTEIGWNGVSWVFTVREPRAEPVRAATVPAKASNQRVKPGALTPPTGPLSARSAQDRLAANVMPGEKL